MIRALFLGATGFEMREGFQLSLIMIFVFFQLFSKQMWVWYVTASWPATQSTVHNNGCIC
jgi:hypothetical protein